MPLARMPNKYKTSRDDGNVSVHLSINDAPHVSCDVALKGIPYQETASEVETAPYSLHLVSRQLFIHPSVFAQCHHHSRSVYDLCD